MSAGSQASRLLRLYSTADERGYIATDFLVCLTVKCNRDGCDLQFLLQKKIVPPVPLVP
ncbi:MAG: hypothetical protein LBP59_07325 [Planctomycetaceae bacterium]|nr:hypothetical protein [Planctomycetaceae bacterium]